MWPKEEGQETRPSWAAPTAASDTDPEAMKRALILAILAATPLAAQTGEERFQNPGSQTIATELATVRQRPDAFKNVWVTFDTQFFSLGKVSNPFFTQFVPSDYANFYAWGGDQPIWRRESYDDVFGMLFVHKDNPEVEELYGLETYARVRVTGVVRNIFQDVPWIEVMTIDPLEGEVDTPTLAHLYRAEQHMARREWGRAISEFSLAPAGGKPNHVLAAVHRGLGTCYLRVGEADKAQSYLAEAVRLDTADRELQALARTARENPRAELDQDVDKSTVAEADRPMWEAFEADAVGQPVRGAAQAKPQR